MNLVKKKKLLYNLRFCGGGLHRNIIRSFIYILFFILMFSSPSCDKGSPIEPNPSPDGFIVFVKTDTIYHCSFIYKMRLDGSEPTQLSFPDETLDVSGPPGSGRFRGFASEPRWSPDGSKIVYSESQGPDESHIVVMNSDGSGKRTITPVGGYAIRPRWSPTGDKILCFRGALGAIFATTIIDTNGRWFDVKISPKSKVFEGDSMFYNLCDVQWHPDGLHLYIWGIPVRREGATGEIFLLNISTGEVVKRVTRNKIDERGFEISPKNGDILIFLGPYQIDRKIYLLRSEDQYNTMQAITSGRNDDCPHWSNDGSLVVFTKDENDDPYNQSIRIYIVDPYKPGSERRVSPIMGYDPDIFITSNGKWR